MDCLRVGRVQTARFYPGTPDRLTAVRWFKCEPDALVFPFPHAFGFNVWEDPEVAEARVIGFLPRLGQWDSGLNHGEAGQHFHGPAAWFLTGIPSSAADVDGRCLRWGGLFTPALGFAVFVGAFTAAGAAALGLKGSFIEGAPAVRAALALAAGWSEVIPAARAALAFAVRAVEAVEVAAAGAVAVAVSWAEAETATASLALAVRWAESAGSFAAAAGFAASASEVTPVLAGKAQTLHFGVVPNVQNGLPFQTVEYDSTGGFDPVNHPYGFGVTAAGVWQFGLNLQWERSGAPTDPGEQVTVVFYKNGVGTTGYTQNPIGPPYDPIGWQVCIVVEFLLAVGDGISLQCTWGNAGAGGLAVSFDLFADFRGPLSVVTPAAAVASPGEGK